MFIIKMKHVNGYEIHDTADTLQEAILYIENEAIGTTENTWTGDLDSVFPIYWQIINEATAELIASGFVDEDGTTT